MFLDIGESLASFSFICSLYSNKIILKKCTWCAWGFEPGPQDGVLRKNLGAVVAAHFLLCIDSIIWQVHYQRGNKILLAQKRMKT